VEAGHVIQQRYRLDAEIGRGSSGIVFRALDLRLNLPCAVKLLLPWAQADDGQRHRLRREARLAGLLRSPHSVAIQEFCEGPNDQLAIVMELLHGQDLGQRLSSRRVWTVEEVAKLAAQALDALAEAHDLGIVHRDLKPGNLFLCERAGEAELLKVLDLGVAKITGAGVGSVVLWESTRLTVSGGVMGSPAYMSPEQCRDEPLTPASDLYSLGVVLYRLLSGQLPFTDPQPVKVMLMHNQTPPPALPPEIAEHPVAQGVLRALAKRPTERFADARQMRAALLGRGEA
jgi:serine/threonine-protein kinase